MSIGNIAAAPPDRTPGNTTRKRRTPLWVMYLLAVIIPVIGLILAIQLAAMERYRDVRRHAIGVLAVAIMATIIGTIIYIVASSPDSRGPSRQASPATPRTDTRVSGDLQTALLKHGIFTTAVPICVHGGGSSYTCKAQITSSLSHKGPGTTEMLHVSDDGHNIAWRPAG